MLCWRIGILSLPLRRSASRPQPRCWSTVIDGMVAPWALSTGAQGVAEVATAPIGLRPLVLANMGIKLDALFLSLVPSRIAGEVCVPHQSGFLPGRQSGAVVLFLELAALRAILHTADEAMMFPSVSQESNVLVLRRLGVSRLPKPCRVGLCRSAIWLVGTSSLSGLLRHPAGLAVLRESFRSGGRPGPPHVALPHPAAAQHAYYITPMTSPCCCRAPCASCPCLLTSSRSVLGAGQGRLRPVMDGVVGARGLRLAPQRWVGGCLFCTVVVLAVRRRDWALGAHLQMGSRLRNIVDRSTLSRGGPRELGGERGNGQGSRLQCPRVPLVVRSAPCPLFADLSLGPRSGACSFPCGASRPSCSRRSAGSGCAPSLRTCCLSRSPLAPCTRGLFASSARSAAPSTRPRTGGTIRCCLRLPHRTGGGGSRWRGASRST